MARKFIALLSVVLLMGTFTGCANRIKKTGDNVYSITYKSHRSEDDARKQAVFKATIECTGLGKKMNIVSEEKMTRRGFVHVLEFECID